MAKAAGREARGPGLLFVLVVLVVVGVVVLRVTGVWPPSARQQGQNLSSLPQVNLPGGQGSSGGSAGGADSRPVVVIYHTHATENYQPAESHARGRAGDIVEVGAELARQLEARGIEAIHLQQLNDWPRYDEAYKSAAEVVKRTLQAHPNVAAVVDIHRDGLPGKPKGYTTGMANGQPAAKILLVVGDLDNPELERNFAFAEQVRTGLNHLYPDLSRGLKTQHQDYNGKLHPNSLTVYIGDYTDNTLEEARRSAAALAEVLAQVVRGAAGPVPSPSPAPAPAPVPTPPSLPSTHTPAAGQT
ncbi:MAG: stage II sporulation protein P [Limnochordaceae bacterium]|nr:stage II sporulation protein P [Limnochordaceae bacterium]